MAIGRREVRLTINGEEWWVSAGSEARLLILNPRPSPHAEIWLSSPDGEILCILTNGSSAWVLYMEEEDDPGFSAMDPDYDGPEDAMITYVLANGRSDEYPASAAVPFSDAVRAAEHFVETFEPAPFITWDLE